VNNVLAAHEPRESATHWEIYTEFGAGALSAHSHGYKPASIKSSANIFDGAIDDVRVSRCIRSISGVPAAPLPADAETAGLWSFDATTGPDRFADSSGHNNPLAISRASLSTSDHLSYRAGPAPLDSHRSARFAHPTKSWFSFLVPNTVLVDDVKIWKMK
jgi:hypothetical protein